MAAGVAVAEHAAHAVADVEDLRSPGLALDRLDAGGHIEEEVAVEVPLPVQVFGPQAALQLQGAAGDAVAAQLEDVDVRPVGEQLLDEAAASEGVAVLRPAGDQQERLAE